MEFRTLHTFLRVLEMGSFSKTAVELGYSQSTVTMQIQQLESELSVKLFERIGRQILPTPAGEKLAVYARTILQTARQAEEDIKTQDVSGKLRIGVAASLCSIYFPRILKKYHETYPKVEIILHSKGQEEMFQMMNRNEIDMVYTLDKKIYRSEFEKIVEGPEEVAFVASGKHPLSHVKNIDMAALLTYDFILTEKGMSYRSQLEEYLAAHNMELHPFLEIGDTDVIRKLLTMGIGISFLPEYTVKESLESGSLTILDVPEYHIQVYRQLLCRKEKFITPQMRVMFEMIREG